MTKEHTFEDAVVAATAARENLDYLITRNTDDFDKSPVPAITPADFLKIMVKGN